MKLKFIFIAAMSAMLSSVLAAEDNFEKLLEKYRNVTAETLLAQREKKQASVILKENLDNTFLDGSLVAVPEKSYSILKTEVTQEFYEAVMGENPSRFKGEKNLPVEKVSWYDAVVFCNKLSVMYGLAPVYSVSGKSDVSEWNYEPHKGDGISNEVGCNENANGYRLPTVEEWRYAAKGGQEFKYSGSDNLDEVAWYDGNSGDKTHTVAQKKPNGYGLYDMSGNVWEWCWDSRSDGERYSCGGGWNYFAYDCEVGDRYWDGAYITDYDLGFRIVRSLSKK